MIDVTPIVVAVCTGVLSIVGAWGALLISSHIKNAQMAQVLNTALANGLGAIKQAEDAHLGDHPLMVDIPGITAPMAAGVQYVLDHAGPELAGLKVPTEGPGGVVEKLNARQGVQKLAILAAPRIVVVPTAPASLPGAPLENAA